MNTRLLRAGLACLFGVALLLSAAGCGGAGSGAGSTVTADPNVELIALIDANTAAANAEDIDAYMACFYPDNPDNASIRRAMQESFSAYRLHYEVSDLLVLDVSADVAHVRGVAATTMVSGPIFRDYKVSVVWELRKYKGAWKIYSRSISAAEYLSPAPTPIPATPTAAATAG